MKNNPNHNYKWRPNDTGDKTLLRYQLEAEHWIEAFKSASNKTSISLTQFFGTVGLILSFLFNLFSLIIILLLDLFVWVSKLLNSLKRRNTEIKIIEKNNISEEEMIMIFKESGNLPKN